MSNRRDFLKSGMTLGAVAAAGVLPGTAAAMIQGPLDPKTWLATSDAAIWQRAWDARFTNTLPNPLDRNLFAPSFGFIYNPEAGTTDKFRIHAAQTTWDILGIGVQTPVWGYGNYEGGPNGKSVTFPGRTFEVKRNQAVTVKWENRLLDGNGTPLPHLLPVDQTITLQTVTSGVPLTIHHHGNDSAFEFDGGPDQWQTPGRVQTGPGVNLANQPFPNTFDEVDPATGKTLRGLQYTYTNSQEASMHWYHDHAQGLTRINAYAGLAGLYIIRDDNEAKLIQNAVLPARDREIALVLQDKTFTETGALSYWADPADWLPDALRAPGAAFADNPTHVPEQFGDVVCVNGVAWPHYDVAPCQYRVRLLNGSDARFYQLSFGAAPVWQIGTDLGLLQKAVSMPGITIAPGERVDLIVDFSKLKGQTIVVGNSANAPFPGGDPVAPGADTILQFRVNQALPARFKPSKAQGEDLRGLVATTPVMPKVKVPKNVVTRRILLGEGSDTYGRIMPVLGKYDPTGVDNPGTLSFEDPATEHPAVGSTEVWEFWNTTEDAHPIHMHLVEFRILDRQTFAGTTSDTLMSNGSTGVRLDAGAIKTGVAIPVPAHEDGLKDTVQCPPGMVTRVMATFKRPGKYVYHCHILSHEEHDMMRWFIVS